MQCYNAFMVFGQCEKLLNDVLKITSLTLSLADSMLGYSYCTGVISDESGHKEIRQNNHIAILPGDDVCLECRSGQ